MSTTKVPKRIAAAIINALKDGAVPRVGLDYISVGRADETNALLHDISTVEDDGAFFRFIIGKCGSGKSFLLQTMRQHAMDRGFAACDATLSSERRLAGTKGQGVATYRELMKSLSVKASPDGDALNYIIEKWIDSLRCEVEAKGRERSNNFFEVEVEQRIIEEIRKIKCMTYGNAFSKVIKNFYYGYRDGNEERQSNALRWLQGDYTSKVQAKRDLDINVIIGDNNWYDCLRITTEFLYIAGCNGLIVMINELESIMKITHTASRQKNYEKILMMYNDAFQGKTGHIGILMSGALQCIEDTRRGLYSCEALRSCLNTAESAQKDTENIFEPIIKLCPLTCEELTVLIEKLTDIHAQLFDYKPRITKADRTDFIKMEFERIDFESHTAPCEVIRDYIEMLDVRYQNEELSLVQAACGGNYNFTTLVPEESDENDEYDDTD